MRKGFYPAHTIYGLNNYYLRAIVLENNKYKERKSENYETFFRNKNKKINDYEDALSESDYELNQHRSRLLNGEG